MPVFDNSQTMMAGSSAQSTGLDVGDYEEKAGLFRGGAEDDCMEKTPAAEGHRGCWTLSCWVKRHKLSTDQAIFGAWSDDNNRDVFRFTSADKLNFQSGQSGSFKELLTTRVFRDTSSWYHICLAVDTGQRNTEANRYRLYINGVEETTLDTNTAHTGESGKINDDVKHWIGARGHSSGPTVDSYGRFSIADMKLIDGHALTPDAFGRTSADTGQWVPKTYANKMKLIPRTDGTAIGDMTSQSGLASAFDGTLFKAYTASASSDGSLSTAYIGKDWGSGNSNKVTGFIVYSITDYGIVGSTASTFTFKLYGSDSSPSNSTDGTLLYTSSSVTDANDRGALRYFVDTTIRSEETVSSFTATTAYRYHWITTTPNATEGVYISQVQFFEDESSAQYGTNGFDLNFAYGGGIERSGEDEYTITAAGTLQRTAAGNADSSAYFRHILTGDFRVDWRQGQTSYAGGGDSMIIGVAPASLMTPVSGTSGWNHGAGRQSTSWDVNFGSTGASDGQCFTQAGAQSHTAVTYSTSTVFSLRRTGSTIKLFVDGSADHTYSATSSVDMVFYYGSGNKDDTNTITNFSIEDDGNGNSGNLHTISLGNDVSGNNNDWITDQSPRQTNDAPYDNLCTMNTNDCQTGQTFTRGARGLINGTTSTNRATHFITDPDTLYYWEMQFESGTGSTTIANIGLSLSYPPVNANLAQAGTWVYMSSGDIYDEGSSSSYGSTYTTGDTIACALYKNAMWFGKISGTTITWQNSATAAEIAAGTTTNAAFTGIPTSDGVAPAMGNHSGSYTHTWTSRFSSLNEWSGITNLPEGATQISTANMLDPSIGASADSRHNDYTNSVLYTGNGTAIGSGGNTITGVGFAPDFVTIRARNSNGLNNMNFDSLRGATKRLYWDGTGAEATDTETLTSFDSDGFKLGNSGNVNENTTNYVAWCFKAGTAQGSTATTGSGTLKTYTADYNTDSRFSIVRYTGNGSDNHTIPHHIGVAPDFVISTRLTGTDGWYVFHSMMTTDPSSDYIRIDSNSGTSDEDEIWTDAVPTSTVVNLGTNTGINANDVPYIMYAWANGDHFMSGRYTGNNSTTDGGPFIWCGFTPQIVITKRYDSSDNWRIIDNARHTFNDGSMPALKMNETDTESDAGNRNVDFLSNGFKIADTDSDSNANEGTYIWCAWAEQPFKYANAI